uniref:BHLH domain-containing protein n=1 Tax=Catharus ustulatus TaxID=91951 RepID=A0A8C3UR46_CATUS
PGEAPPGEGSVAVAAVPGAPGAFAEGGLQYQFRSDTNGQVSTPETHLRQVTEAPLDGTEGGAVSVVSDLRRTPQVCFSPQVLQNPFSNGGSPGSEGGAEGSLGHLGHTWAHLGDTWAHLGGRFGHLGTPGPTWGHLGGHLGIRGHTWGGDWKLEGPRVPRDERRRAQHNEVERRRRDKINNWIVQLSKIIPECGADGGKAGAQGRILSKACDYVRELRQSNARLQETFKEAERLQVDNDLLRQQELKSENAALRAQLQQRGLGGNHEGINQ